VTLPGFWTKEALEAIGNKLGVFVGLEPNWESKADCRWDWIQIEVDVRKGLVGNMDFVFGEHTWHQKVEYWKIHFYCFVCMLLAMFNHHASSFLPYSIVNLKYGQKEQRGLNLGCSISPFRAATRGNFEYGYGGCKGDASAPIK
jgi:hypothetical protein